MTFVVVCIIHFRVVSLSLCSHNECFISGSLERTVLLWDQRAEKCQGLLRVQGRPAISYDDQGLVFSIAFGGYIRMFDARKYEKLSTYNVKPVSSNCTLESSFSPEGMFVISGSGDGRAYAWSVRSGKEVILWSYVQFERLYQYLNSFQGISMVPIVLCSLQVASRMMNSEPSVINWNWMSTDTEPLVIKWAPGSLMFVTRSTELSFWIPDLCKLAAYVGRK
ncbi:hypothetical protein CRYUN_Cryun17cG0144600 [Craigia yunnanensis]